MAAEVGGGGEQEYPDGEVVESSPGGGQQGGGSDAGQQDEGVAGAEDGPWRFVGDERIPAEQGGGVEGEEPLQSDVFVAGWAGEEAFACSDDGQQHERPFAAEETIGVATAPDQRKVPPPRFGVASTFGSFGVFDVALQRLEKPAGLTEESGEDEKRDGPGDE